MNYIWGGVVGLGLLASIGLAYLTHSVMPLGVYVFATVFWTMWIRTNMVLNTGGFVPGELLVILTGCVIFVFIAAVVGMFTGSG